MNKLDTFVSFFILFFCFTLVLVESSYGATASTTEVLTQEKTQEQPEIPGDLDIPTTPVLPDTADTADTAETPVTPSTANSSNTQSRPATKVESDKSKPTLSKRIQIFIPSEEIDTAKAVAFPTNI